MITNTGGRTLSTALPRRQPATVPIRVPKTKARSVVIPTSPTVQGSACLITVFTETGKNDNDVPNCPVRVLRR